MILSQQCRYHYRDRQAEAAPERSRGEEDNAPSHDWVERLAGFIFQLLGLRYSVVLAVVGGLNAALQRIASHQCLPVPRSSLGS